MIVRIIAFALGIGAGVGFFQVALYWYEPGTLFYDRWMQLYSGTIASHDTIRHTIIIRMPSAFPNGESGLVRFRYSDATEWSSIAYRLQDGATVSREMEIGKPPQLPEGTLVTVMRDLQGEDEWSTSLITFLRRIES